MHCQMVLLLQEKTNSDGSEFIDHFTITWFGDLSYRSKYAFELKREIEESNADKCPYCTQYLVLFEIRGVDRPPPDQEWFGLMERSQAYSVETIEEMLERKFWLKNRLEEEYRLANASDTTITDTTLDEELCSVPS